YARTIVSSSAPRLMSPMAQGMAQPQVSERLPGNAGFSASLLGNPRFTVLPEVGQDFRSAYRYMVNAAPQGKVVPQASGQPLKSTALAPPQVHTGSGPLSSL